MASTHRMPPVAGIPRCAQRPAGQDARRYHRCRRQGREKGEGWQTSPGLSPAPGTAHVRPRLRRRRQLARTGQPASHRHHRGPAAPHARRSHLPQSARPAARRHLRVSAARRGQPQLLRHVPRPDPRRPCRRASSAAATAAALPEDALARLTPDRARQAGRAPPTGARLQEARIVAQGQGPGNLRGDRPRPHRSGAAGIRRRQHLQRPGLPHPAQGLQPRPHRLRGAAARQPASRCSTASRCPTANCRSCSSRLQRQHGANASNRAFQPKRRADGGRRRPADASARPGPTRAPAARCSSPCTPPNPRPGHQRPAGRQRPALPLCPPAARAASRRRTTGRSPTMPSSCSTPR